MAKTVVGSFDSYDEAQRVMQALVDRGFDRDDISVVARDTRGGGADTVGDADDHDAGDTAAGAAKGAMTGAGIGGVAGLVVGLAGLSIPGIGPVIAAGPIAAALTGAGIGAVAGGIIGGLTHLGVSDEDAHYYAENVKRGGALVLVRADDARADDAATLMRDHGAVDIDKRAEEWRASGWNRFDESSEPYVGREPDSSGSYAGLTTAGGRTDAAYAARPGESAPAGSTTRTGSMRPDEVGTGAGSGAAYAAAVTNAGKADYSAGNRSDAGYTTGTPSDMRGDRGDRTVLPVVEEELKVGKREVDRGGVRVYTHTTERPVEEQVTLREERATVERRPVNRPATEADLGMAASQDRSIEIRETSEEPVVQKTARVVEEVEVGKEVNERTETIRDTVRRTDVDVDNNLGSKTPRGDRKL